MFGQISGRRSEKSVAAASTRSGGSSLSTVNSIRGNDRDSTPDPEPVASSAPRGHLPADEHIRAAGDDRAGKRDPDGPPCEQFAERAFEMLATHSQHTAKSSSTVR